MQISLKLPILRKQSLCEHLVENEIVEKMSVKICSSDIFKIRASLKRHLQNALTVILGGIMGNYGVDY